MLREAGRYRNRGAGTEELNQIASLGLMKAIAGFDPRHGKRFVSYLLPTVSGETKRHFRDNLWAVHVSRTHRERRGELNRFVADFTQSRSRTPKQSEISAHFGMDDRATPSAAPIGTWNASSTRWRSGPPSSSCPERSGVSSA